MRYVFFAILLVVACGPEVPSVDAWEQQHWQPMVQAVPTPEEARQSTCQVALERLRELAVGLDPAPSEELSDAAHGWVDAAESLVFSCASEREVDYKARYDRLLLRQAEVEVVLNGS